MDFIGFGIILLYAVHWRAVSIRAGAALPPSGSLVIRKEELFMSTAYNITSRTVKRSVTGRKAVDGAGVRLVRVLGSPTVVDYDPFLMLDAFDSVNPEDYTKGFPMHPHRGIETVTYLAQGRIEHEDSLGNKGAIESGGCQWMTAGSGIMHQEMPIACPRMLGLQLWVNLAAKDKMVQPKYRDIHADQIVSVKEDGAQVRVLSGRYREHKGAMKADYVPVTFLDVYLDAGATWSVDTDPDHTLFVYVLEGGCSDAAGNPVPARHAVLFGEGGRLTLVGGNENSRLVVVSGKPLHEPVAWGGPIVMNTDDELREAFFELEDGTFIKHKKVAGA